jgi:adenylate kinase
MKNIIFVAPPAAGKGTQSELLVKKYGLVHISTGDLLREEVKEQTELGKSIEGLMSSGQLIGTEIVTELLKKRLSKNDIENGFILDGYPRTLEQAKILSGLLTELNYSINNVIYLEMDVELATHRALGRITCPKCKRGYNKYEEATKPLKDNICDDCGIELVGRSDDNEESFKIRFETYEKEVKPILNYYSDLGILNIIDNSGTPEETFKNIESVI